MAQSSGPIAQGTDAERQFTDVLWRDLFGDEPGVYGDTNGTAYFVGLPPDSNIVSVGSQQIDSLARVAGFSHRIPVGQPEGIEIPPASGSARTDIIALRYDPAYTGAPGPVRMIRTEGTSSGLPNYDASPPGVEDLPLWAITRVPGQALSQATVKRIFPRTCPVRYLEAGAPLPLNSPIGTRLRQGATEYVRDFGAGGVPIWVNASPGRPPAYLSVFSEFNNPGGTIKPATYWREEHTAFVIATPSLKAPLAGLQKRAFADLPDGFRPNAVVTVPTSFDSRWEVFPNGRINLVNGRLAAIEANVPVPLNFPIPLG